MILKPVLDKLFHLREKTGQAAGAAADPYEKPFLDHLEDLRSMFFKMIITQVIVTILAFIFHAQLFDFCFEPVRSPRSMIDVEVVDDAGEPVLNAAGETIVEKVSLESKINLIILSPPEAFMLSIKVAFIAGFILAFPLHAYFVAQFILPGLTAREKKLLIPGIAVGFVLFLCGSSFAFLGALPYALKFLFSYGLSLDLESTWRIGYYIGFVTQVTLIFGLCWELPLVVTILVKLRLLTFRAMKGSRTIAIMVLTVLSAVFTPPDPVTMVFMAVPMIILYEICIWIAYFLDRKRDAIEAAEEAEYQEWLVKHKEEEARLAEERKQLAAASPDHTALNDDWDKHDEDYDHDADHADYYSSDQDPHGAGGQADEDGWIDQYSEDLSEVECPEDRSNIARRRKRRALLEAAKAQAEALVNVNQASLAELTSLPGIGEATAEKILAGGPYGTIEDLLQVEGVTQARLDAIESRIFAG